jgi:hypothetical protein
MKKIGLKNKDSIKIIDNKIAVWKERERKLEQQLTSIEALINQKTNEALSMKTADASVGSAVMPTSVGGSLDIGDGMQSSDGSSDGDSESLDEAEEEELNEVIDEHPIEIDDEDNDDESSNQVILE